MESMMDDLAKQAGKDPVEFRREYLAKHPRILKVLNTAAEKSGWGSALPTGRARGIAVHESFGSVCAHVAEVSVDNGQIKVHRVTSAIDCGLAVNPLSIIAQVEGAMVFGLSAALYGKVTLKDGVVDQSNFHDYPVLRINEMPVVDVHLVASTEPPGGIGEPVTATTGPSVANAIFNATGKRIRKMPITADELKNA